MTALIIVLLALMAVGLLPLGCHVRYDGAPCLRVTVGPARITLYPAAEKPKKEKKPRAARKKPRKARRKPSAPEQPERRFTPQDLAALRPLLGTALEALGAVRRSLCIRRLRVVVRFGAADAAARAIRYGQAWALIGALTPLVENAFRVKKRALRACYDPEATDVYLLAEAHITLRVWQLMYIGLRYGARLLSQFLKLKRTKAVQKHEPSTL